MSKLSSSVLITTGAVLFDQRVYVWGFRSSAQQGSGAKSVASKEPAEVVTTLKEVSVLTGGTYHLLALEADGRLYSWGHNIYGECGCDGHYVAQPHEVMSGVIQAEAGEYFSMALTSDKEVFTWGYNMSSQLGNGNRTHSSTPYKINVHNEKVRLIGATYEGAFAVTEEGHVWSWGNNEACGLGFSGGRYGVKKLISIPTRATILEPYAQDIITISGGNGWGEALLKDGRVIGWGLHAALGIGVNPVSITSPEPVEILQGVKELNARCLRSIALKEDGTVYTWGRTNGRVFPMIYGNTAELRVTQAPVVAIGGGKDHIFYQVADGTIYGVGYNDFYKLDQTKANGAIDWPGIRIELMLP